MRNQRPKPLPDLLQPNLKVAFCGESPGWQSAAAGHYYTNPRNRFWRVLYAAGFTDRLFTFNDDHDLLKLGIGMTDVLAEPGAKIEGRTGSERKAILDDLESTVIRYQPRYLAIIGLGVWRALIEKGAQPGPQQKSIGSTQTWLLPSTSGMNPMRTDDLSEHFRRLRIAAFGALL